MEPPRRIEPTAARADIPRLNILIVEDNLDGANSLAWLLRRYGYEVEIAQDGPAALKMAEAHAPDVVLLDIGLPGMSGFEVARQLNEHSPEKKAILIVMSGFGSDEDRHRSAEVGIDLHLVKPVEPTLLRGILERCHTAING
jgi:two-component system CheB/CheR fusion protein